MSAVMEKETQVPTGNDAVASVPAIVSRKAHLFVQMLIEEGQIASQEEFASAAYQAHYERIRDKMFGKKAETGSKKPGLQKKVTK